jgi:hypothetical protein
VDILLLAHGEISRWRSIRPGESAALDAQAFQARASVIRLRPEDTPPGIPFASGYGFTRILDDAEENAALHCVARGLTPPLEPWKESAARHAIAITRRATYPAIEGIGARHAITVFVIELPPEGSP